MKAIILWCITGSLLVGCNLDSNTSLENKLSALQLEIESIKNELETHREAISDLIDPKQDYEKIAYLTPGADGYSQVKFDLGVLTIKLSDIKPYANGSKVTLTFGNTLSASINGLKATIDWGNVTKSGAPDHNSKKSKELTFNKSLRAGAWTPVSVVLDGIPPAELGFVRVRDVAHTGIGLIR